VAGPVGLLALQGDFAAHQRALTALGAETRLVRRPGELSGCGALVVPGGESTTLARLLDRAELRSPLVDFAASHPVLGTCAGLILLARELAPEVRGDHGGVPLGLLDCLVQRNGYGRQVDSFLAHLPLQNLGDGQDSFPGVFIRAPRILSVGPRVQILAIHRQEPVAVRQGTVMGLTFHPELTEDTRFHAAFLAAAATG